MDSDMIRSILEGVPSKRMFTRKRVIIEGEDTSDAPEDLDQKEIIAGCVCPECEGSDSLVFVNQETGTELCYCPSCKAAFFNGEIPGTKELDDDDDDKPSAPEEFEVEEIRFGRNMAELSEDDDDDEDGDQVEEDGEPEEDEIEDEVTEEDDDEEIEDEVTEEDGEPEEDEIEDEVTEEDDDEDDEPKKPVKIDIVGLTKNESKTVKKESKTIKKESADSFYDRFKNFKK